MAITTRDGLVAAMAQSQSFPFYRATIGNQAAGNITSLWRATGLPAQGATPGAAAVCDDSLTGALNNPFTNAGVGQVAHVVRFDVSMAIAGAVYLYDRLAHMGGLSGTVTTAQTVNVSLPTTRGGTSGWGYSDGVEWFLEWYADTGASAVTATVSYTNEQGVSGRTTTVSLAATMRASRLLQISPANGDLGIRSVESVTLSATTGTAGSFGVTAARRLAGTAVNVANTGVQMDAMQLAMPVVYDDACLWLTTICTGTSTGMVFGQVQIGAG
jgi:hypothetical protein